VTLEENIQQLRDSLSVTSAQTLRHETRIKEHQQWLEQMEIAFASVKWTKSARVDPMGSFDRRRVLIA